MKEKKADNKTAVEEAYKYLANRMRTTAEVRKHLEGKGFANDEVTEAVNELIGMRYLDDYTYAVRYYEYNREKKRGVLRAERELIEKGIDKETVQFAKEDFIHEQNVDEFKDAMEIARKEVFAESGAYGVGPQALAVDDKLAAKIARKLETRGFARSDIFKVLDEARRWKNE